MDKLTIRDVDVADKRVLVRVDFNVPLEDGKVTDDSRIRAALPTIRYLLAHGAKVILASHLGRPKGKVHDGLRLRPAAERLTQLIGRNVSVTGDALGVGTVDAIKRLRPGELILLENLRFHAEEEKNDPKFAEQLAAYADIYVNDAFGTAHRAHASTVGVAKLLPAYAGFLMEQEIAQLSDLLESPARPFAAIVGGAKVSGKLNVLDSLMSKIDLLVLEPGLGLCRGTRRSGDPAGRRHRRQGGHAGDRVQDTPRRQDPGLVAHRRRRPGDAGADGKCAGRCQDRLLEWPDRGVRDPVLCPRDESDRTLPGRAL